jgi:hypothetical protein
MVIFRRPDGKPGYHQADSVEDALRFVEMLRNQEKVTDARIFRMEEVPIEVRTYYRVEVVGEQAPQALQAPQAPQATSGAPDAPTTDDLDPMPVEVGAGKGRRFGRN